MLLCSLLLTPTQHHRTRARNYRLRVIIYSLESVVGGASRSRTEYNLQNLARNSRFLAEMHETPSQFTTIGNTGRLTRISDTITTPKTVKNRAENDRREKRTDTDDNARTTYVTYPL